MKNILLAALLTAVPGLAAARPVVEPTRRAQIEAQAAQWAEVKARGRRATDALLARVAVDPAYDAASYRKGLDSAWATLESIEQSEIRRQGLLDARLRSEAASGVITLAQLAQRSEVVARLVCLRLLFAYGDILPRVLDEAVRVNDRNVGRYYAGADWQQVLTQDEWREVHGDRLEEASRFLPPELLDGPF